MPVSRLVAPIAVVLLAAVSVGVRFWAARGLDVPWIAPDETIYALLGRSLWEDGSPSLLGATAGSYSFVYPALIGLPLTLGSVETGVIVVQALGAVLMSSTAVLVYLWGRGPLGTWWAVAAAGLTLAVPDLAYSGLVMSEVAVFPVATLAVWAIASALARPSPRRQALVAAAILLALATHIRLLALVPTLFVAVALQCGFARSLEPARRQAALLAGAASVCTIALAGFAVAGSWHDAFGAYAAAVGGYGAGAAATDVVWHTGGVFVLVAGIPLVALVAMTVECVAGRLRDPSACALVATTVAWTSCLVLEVGTFASRWVGHLALRDLQPVVPPLMLVFALWLARGTPRRAPWIEIGGFGVAAAALALPIRRFAIQESALDAFSLIPLWRFAEATSGLTLELVYSLAVSALVGLAVFLPRRMRIALPAVVALTLVVLSIVSTSQIERLTRLDRAWVFDTGDPRWVDRAADGPVLYLQAGTKFSAGIWKHAFWNRQIDAVAYLPAAARVPPLAPTVVDLQPDGLLRTRAGGSLRAPLVVSPSELELFGRPIARAPRSTDTTGLTLWRAELPVRVSTVRSGVHPNGDVLGTATITVYGCGRGRLELTLFGKQGTPLELRVNGITWAQPTIAPDEVWNETVPAPPNADGRSPCVFELVSPGLVGSTRLEFVRNERD